jgi:predicted XRE-type DNA-binding protein
LRKFPEEARREAGQQLFRIQQGEEPADWKPTETIGSGVREIIQGSDPGGRPVKEETFANVWDAIEDDPAVAENLKLRSSLMIELERHIKREGWTQAQAAKALGVTQPRISNLLRGKIGAFSLDLLVKMATTAGLRVTLRVRKAA